MRAEVLAYCRREALFQPGERVACAVSGGADSMAMLCCLRSCQEALGIDVFAVHFNHCLRGTESERDEAFVRDFCRTHGIALEVGRADVRALARERGKGLEEAARQLRYDFFHRIHCDRIATAHTADDNAETVLLHLLRGSGLRGLCGIPPKRGRIVRPLLCVTHKGAVAYLQAQSLCWCEDSTNAADDCLRNRLRHRVLPLLREEAPQLSMQLLRQSALLRSEDAFLDNAAQELLQPLAQPDTFQIAPAPDALEKRALRLLLRRYLPQDVSLTHIEAVQKLLHAASPSAECMLPDGLRVQRRYAALHFTREVPPVFTQTPLCIPGQTLLPMLGLRIICTISEKREKFSNSPFQFAIKYDIINNAYISARPRAVGDMLTLQNGHTKTLKKLFIDRKLPKAERDRLPVIATGTQVLAVAGLGINHRYAATASEPALLIRIEWDGERPVALFQSIKEHLI